MDFWTWNGSRTARRKAKGSEKDLVYSNLSVAKKPERSTGQAGGIQKYRRLVLLDCSASKLKPPSP